MRRISMAEAPKTLDRDEQRLAELGYKQDLSRVWSGFSNFAISFTIISILAGCFTTYQQAWLYGGPVNISWGWPIIVGLIMFVALSMSELASAYPTAGGPYWWAYQLGGAGWSWFTGWFNVIGLIAIVASVDYAAAVFGSTLFNLWGVDVGVINWADGASLRDIFALFVVLLILHALVNIYSSHLVALLNNISVWWHLFGFAAIVLILIFVPDRHQSANFVFTETMNASGFDGGATSGLVFLLLVVPVGWLLTMYTETGYDASAHVAEETHDAEMAAAKGIWRAVLYSGILGYVVLLAITFAATDLKAIAAGIPPIGAGYAPTIFISAMSDGWAETVILLALVGQIFCGMACLTSCSRTFYAFSRDHAVPGWQLWAKVDKRHVPVYSVLICAVVALIITIPALKLNSLGYLWAFYAVTTAGTMGLYAAYVIPVYLRWRKGDSFQTGAWNLGAKYKWMNPIAVVWVIICLVAFSLPFYTQGLPWRDDFDWTWLNYGPILLFGVIILAGIWWLLGANKRYTGPVRTIEFDEAMRVLDDAKPAEAPGS
jgi:amino acid transporter